MKKSDEFLIQFVGLKQGSHDFDWEIGDTFFDDFGEVDFTNSRFKVDMELVKQTNMLVLEFDIKGSISCTCDLCLDDITLSVTHQEQLIVKFSSAEEGATEEMVVLGIGEYELDVKQFIYEFIQVALPLRRVCEDAGKNCNPEMIAKLSEFNLTEPEGSQGPEEKQDDEDSTWDALKSLKDKFRNN